MKKLLFVSFVLILTLSCNKFDDSLIWEKINEYGNRIAYLEEVCKNMNDDIVSLQALVSAIEANDCVVSVSSLVTNDGYTITFKSGKSIVIRDGKNGENGKNGDNGYTPIVSAKKDNDGFYYWTVDGQWLIIDGVKVKASATDGKEGVPGTNGINGTNGSDGITPKFKIEDDYWYVSYTNGASWEKLGKAKGDNGLAGENGDSLFKKVYVEDGYVCFEMNDSENTIIRIPLIKDGKLEVTLLQPGTLSSILSSAETRTTTDLTIKGEINLQDLRHVQIMNNLTRLDLSKALCESDFELNPYMDTIINKSITEVVLPDNVHCDFSYCLALSKVSIAGDNTGFQGKPAKSSLKFCPNVVELEYLEGVTNASCSAGYSSSWPTAYSLKKVVYPSTLTKIPCELAVYSSWKSESLGTNYYLRTFTFPYKSIVCKAVVPPVADASYNTSYKAYQLSRTIHRLDLPEDIVLYVPKESIELYRIAPLWENFKNIQAIPE